VTAPEFVGRQLVKLALTVLGISLIAFAGFKLMPGDPALIACNPKAHECGPAALARARHEMGLDRPFLVQYWFFIKTWLQGHPLGWDAAWPAFVNTISLLTGVVFIEVIVGGAMGVLAAVRHRQWQDKAVIVASAILIAPPTFLFATLFRYIFTSPFAFNGRLDLSKTFMIDVDPPPFPQPLDPAYWMAHLMWPSLAVATGGIGIVALVARSALLDVFGHDYTMAARARGVSERRIIALHSLKEIAPVIITTVFLVDIARLLLAEALVEVVWSWPGAGSLAIGAAGARNGPLLVTTVMLLTLTVAIVATVVDIVHGVVDPRVASALD
jgi:ABC-type dipeptide/oligopeptide/nickel transport system permease component